MKFTEAQLEQAIIELHGVNISDAGMECKALVL